MPNTHESLRAPLKLSELVAGFVRSSESPLALDALFASGIQLDSRLVKKGDVFLALFGRNHDARDFIQQAITAGAVAVLVESGREWENLSWIGPVPVIPVDALSANASALAGRFYGNPSERAGTVGITGTNGKTSCATFCAQSLEALGVDPATIGTLGYGRPGRLATTALTTPDPVFTQRALAELVASGVEAVIMEVSSVGLHQRRVEGVSFDTAVFTNLTRDHLDYHGTMAAYGASKKRLFLMPGLRHAVINLDDAYALDLINDLPSSVALITYSEHRAEADFTVKNVKLDPLGIAFDLVTPLGTGRVTAGLLGRFNLSNLLAVAACLFSQYRHAPLPTGRTLDLASLLLAVSALQPVPGRMQLVRVPECEVTVVVDYAHTPDALKSALIGLRDHFSGRLCCVFGAGGNRDIGKRPLMAEVAERHADLLMLTDDNPREESGESIIEQLRSGLERPDSVLLERDRARAIERLVAEAQPGDVVLIAGKGHENYQEVSGVRHPFDDVAQAQKALGLRDRKRSGL